METILGEKGDVIIPDVLIKQVHLMNGQKVSIEVQSGKIIISPSPNHVIEKFRELAQRVKINTINSDVLHEEMIQDRLGL
jgi:antitoxin component of MazEF toxin-antitoxin module